MQQSSLFAGGVGTNLHCHALVSAFNAKTIEQYGVSNSKKLLTPFSFLRQVIGYVRRSGLVDKLPIISLAQLY